MPEVTAWQNRPLETVYPFVFLDAIHYKVKSRERGQIRRFPGLDTTRLTHLPGNTKGKSGSGGLAVLEHELELGQNHVPI